MGRYSKPKSEHKSGFFTKLIRVFLLTFFLGFVALIAFGEMDQSKEGLDKLMSVFSTSAKEIKKVSRGIDVARYQGTIDWKQAAESGVEFAMVRLGYRTQVDGQIVEDSNARYNMQEASKNGIMLGAYFFSTAVTPEEAREEAAWAAALMEKYPITYPVAYNCEGFLDPENRQHGLSKEERTEIARTFLETIEEFGYEGMFYASKNEMEGDTHWLVSKLQKDYKIWVAQYPDRPYPETGESSYSGKHHMWQFTTLGHLPGIEQNVDCDLSYFSYNKTKKPKDPVPPATVKADVEALMNFKAVNETVTAKEETNLRNLPNQGAESMVLYTLKNGETATRIGISSNGWSKLSFKDNIYYAVSNYLTTDLGGGGGASKDSTARASDEDGIQTQFEDVAEEKVTAKDEVNLRSIPSVTDEESKVIVKLKKGDYAVRTGVSSNGWSRLRYKDQTCYAITNYLVGESGPIAEFTDGKIHTQFESISDKVTPKDAVNLRTRPTVQEGESEVRVKLKHGEVVERTGINRDLGWSRVVYNGEELYCISNYLEQAEG